MAKKDKNRVYVTPTPTWPRALTMIEGEAERIPDSPRSILLWGLAKNKHLVFFSTLLVSVYFVSLTLLPWALGRMLDSVWNYGFSADLLLNASVFLGLVFLLVITSPNEIISMATAMRGAWNLGRRLVRVLFGRRTNVGRDMPSGDVVTTITQDTNYVGYFYSFVPDLISSLISASVAIILMINISVPLGITVGAGLPVMMFLSTKIMGPLQKKIAQQREESGILTSLATDGVAGLRVMRGVGGEDTYNRRYREQSLKVRDAGIKAAPYRALLTIIQSAGPTLFNAIAVGGGLYLTYKGSMTPGQLVAFYGFSVYLGIPLTSLGQTLASASRAKVGARKISTILNANYLVSDQRVAGDLPEVNWAEAQLKDEASGVVITPGKLTALVSQMPEESALIAARLARTNDGDEVFINDVDMRLYPLETVRKNLAYSPAVAELYSGTLRSNLLGPDASDLKNRRINEQIVDILKPGGETRAILSEKKGAHLRDPQLLEKIEVAAGHDIITSVQGGLDGQVAERGRSLSGGQKQRTALARILALEAPITILVEPTSALDSHTEMKVAHNLAKERQGKTTVVVSTSPLVLDQCDEIVLIEGGSEIARGTHSQLRTNPAYVSVVHRGQEEEK